LARNRRRRAPDFEAMSLSKLVSVLAFASTGCSFISLSSPPTTGPQLQARRAEACGRTNSFSTWVYPLADATWVLGGVADIVTSDQRLKDDPSNKGLYETIGWFGIASVAIATPSLIYGLWVAGQCRKEPASGEEANQAVGATRRKFDFPTALNGFAFGSDSKSAERVCFTQGDTLEADQNSARCVPKDPVARPTIELEYELGALTRIALVYRAQKGLINNHFDLLEQNLQSQYGTPQRHRRLSDRCIQSLGYCLQQGETPQGAGWHFPNGNIDMLPTLEQGDPVIIIRYSRDPGG
jgi:hypothetical protein